MPTQAFNHAEKGDYIQDSKTGKIGVVVRSGSFRIDGKYTDAIECKDVNSNQKFYIPDGNIIHLMATSGRLKSNMVNLHHIVSCLEQCITILEDEPKGVWEKVENCLYPVFIMLEKQDIPPVSLALDQIRVSTSDMIASLIDAIEYLEELNEFGSYGYP